jgi:hypothetical protein
MYHISIFYTYRNLESVEMNLVGQLATLFIRVGFKVIAKILF